MTTEIQKGNLVLRYNLEAVRVRTVFGDVQPQGPEIADKI